ncbi:RHS repeat domain-containing protein [Dactylosporangium sp. NPDC000521]|uniref:RHS repeat domain-containing protein n=1 Tax=Dactylosporangium sp. NPDC000521 TaxID=3363975 RepID=UPI003693F11E
MVSVLQFVPGSARQDAPSVQRESQVAGRNVKPGPALQEVTGKPFRPAPAVWPAPATAVVDVPASGARVAGTPIRLDLPGKTGSAGGTTRLRVEVFDRSAAARAGVDGLLVGVSPVDGTPAGTTVRVSVDYSAFRWAYGADWGDRLRLTSPDGSTTVTPAGNDAARGTVSGLVQVGAATTLAVAAAPAGPTGDYAATDLKPSGTWSSGGNSGDFSWKYPLRTPPSVGGPAPVIELGYSSAGVDGKMVAANSQPSMIGEGFDWEPGFIERRYRTCSEDMGNGANNTVKTGDLCWTTDNATLSLGEHSGDLIRDGANTDRWFLRNADGVRVERKWGSGNGARNGEYWVATTPDGTQYWFGSQADRNSTLKAPVFGNHVNEPCKAAAFKDSACTQAWRWQLDHVVDPAGNTMSYWYDRETNKYAKNNTTTDLATYDRSGHVTRIDYGTNNAVAGSAPAQVTFQYADRCLADCGTHDGPHWPDTPWDQQCTASPCTNSSPTFWTTRRMTGVTTKVLNAGTSTYRDVESWTFTQSFPDPGDGTRGGLWLERISRKGLAGEVTTTPDITFVGVQLSNRVDTLDHSPAMNRLRIKTINTESGGKIDVTYSAPDCVAGTRVPDKNALQNNTLRCYPVKWNPDGYTDPIVDFFHKYVVTDVTETDQVAGSPVVHTHYDYVGTPAWHYTEDDGLIKADFKTWSVWRGYGAVQTTKGEGAERTFEETRYFRGMHGDKLPSGTRTVVLPAIATGNVPAVNDEDAFSGMVRESILFNGPGGAEVSATVSQPWQSPALATRTINGTTVSARYAKEGVAYTRTTLDRAPGVRTTTKRTTYDDTYGVGVKVDDAGDDAVTGDEKCSTTDYVRNTGAWIQVSSRERDFGVSCAKVDAGGLTEDDIIGDERISYDGQAWGAQPIRGLATRTEKIKAYQNGTPTYLTVGTRTYDGYGRVDSETDVRGNTTTTTFVPATGGPVTGSVRTSPPGWATTVTIDPAFGNKVTTVDSNGRRVDMAYDGLGRLRSVWLAGRDKATQTANYTYEYRIRNDGPSVVTQRTLNADGGYVTVRQLHDGMLRARQTQASDGTGGPKAVISDTLYDSAGRVKTERNAYLATVAPSDDLYLPTGTVPSQTTTLYDGAGREAHKVFQVDAAPASPGGTEKWRTSTRYGGNHTDVVAPPGGINTTTVTDAAGQIVERRQYKPGVTVGDPAPAGFDATKYTYDRRGKLVQVVDPVGNTWTYGYDLRGRKTSVSDPDAGTTNMDYNDADDVVKTTDGRGVVLAYTHDAIGRKTSIRDGSSTGPKRAEWVYDTLANGQVVNGQLVKTIRYAGTEQYTTEYGGFTIDYQPTSTKYVIPPSEGALAGTYQYVFTYKQDGSPATTRMPGVGDLVTETLTTGYNALRKPDTLSTSLTGSTLVTGTDYTSFGEPAALHLRNNGGSTVDVVRTYDEKTRRLNQIWTSKQTGPTTLSDVRYTYDEAGNVTAVNDLTSGDKQCFQSDYARRLLEAWTPATDCTTGPSTASVATGTGAYWQSFRYDAAGNRTSQVERLTPAGTRTTDYATNTGKHTLSGTTTTDNLGTRTASYTYDLSGNTLTRPAPGSGTQTLTWDADGNLATSTDSSGPTSYVYDIDGGRLIRTDPAGKTLYLPGQELRATTAGVKTATRYYTHGGDTVAFRTAGGLTWMASDHQGTTSVVVNAVTQAVGTRRQTPFGTVRVQSGTWPAGMDKGFVGGTNDNTGLTHLGAREYDQGTGRFISRDPEIDDTDPQQMNGYAYANNMPVTASDADGRRPACEGSDCSGLKEWAAEAAHNALYAPAVGAIYVGKVRDQYHRKMADIKKQYEVLRRTEGAEAASRWASEERANVRKWAREKLPGFDEMMQKVRPGKESLAFDDYVAKAMGDRAVKLPDGRWDLSKATPADYDTVASKAMGKSNAMWDALGKGAKWGGRAFIAADIAYGVYNVATAPPEERVKVAAEETGRIAGALVGAKVGATIGASIGACGGPVGILVGGVVGGVAGAIIGGGVGKKIGGFFGGMFGGKKK